MEATRGKTTAAAPTTLRTIVIMSVLHHQMPQAPGHLAGRLPSIDELWIPCFDQDQLADQLILIEAKDRRDAPPARYRLFAYAWIKFARQRC